MNKDLVKELFYELLEKHKGTELSLNIEYGCSRLNTETEKEIQEYKDRLEKALST